MYVKRLSIVYGNVSTSQTRKVLYQLIILISKFIKIKTYENC